MKKNTPVYNNFDSEKKSKYNSKTSKFLNGYQEEYAEDYFKTYDDMKYQTKTDDMKQDNASKKNQEKKSN